MATAGDLDAGDLGGIPAVAWECRDRVKIELAKNVDDANSRALERLREVTVSDLERRSSSDKTATELIESHVIDHVEAHARQIAETRGVV